MGAILDRLLAKSGKTVADLPRNTTLGKITRRRGVNSSRELDRILNLPERDWAADPDLPELVQALTEYLRTPEGQQTLRPIQAVALSEGHNIGGALVQANVGEGKTIPSFLIAKVLEARRPLLILPAKLIPKTEHERERLKVHWQLPSHLHLISYEKLGVVSGATFLENYRPDLIIADEVHRLKNLKAARTRRMRRYMELCPDTAFVALSGTIMRKSLRDFHHILQWCLPPELRPLPDSWTELQDWADALDARVARRLAPGALLRFCRPGEEQDLRGVRQAFGRRLASTPGIIISQGKGIPNSLTVEAKVFDTYSPELESAVHLLNSKWDLPDEWRLTDAPVKWAQLRQLTRGFYYRPNPRPPPDYIAARRAWGGFVRDALKRPSLSLDSELQVRQACRKGILDSNLMRAWDGIKDTFKPIQETIWLDYSFLYDCAQWLEKERGVLWVEHVEFGRELSEVTGFPYFGAGGMDQKGNHIMACKGGPIICSLRSIGEGQNLQDRWYKCRFSCPPGSGPEYEQGIGRFHRQYQEADTVEVQVDLTCKEDFAALVKAKEEQETTADTFRNEGAKLIICDWLCPTALEIGTKSGPRWQAYD